MPCSAVTLNEVRLKLTAGGQGVHRYIDLRVHDDIRGAYDELRADGYKIMVSDLKEDALGPKQLQDALVNSP